MTTAPPALPADLDAGFRRLRLGAMRRLSAELLVTAKTQRWAPEELLRTLIDAEIASRDASNARERLRQAAFPVTKTLDEFNVATSSVRPATYEYLSSLEWVRAKENLCLVGPPGTGKSHLLVALGHHAVASGLRVRYFTAADLVETLYRGMADNSVGRVIETILRADLVLIDEIGFAPLDSTGAQLFFRIVAGAYERRSLGVGSHWPFEDWGRFLPEHSTAVSLLDRLLHQPSWWSPRAIVPHEGSTIEGRTPGAEDGLITPEGWGLLVATTGDFHLAIDTADSPAMTTQPKSVRRAL